MIQFEVGKLYDCGSYNENDNLFRIASRTDTTVDLIAIYEIEGVVLLARAICHELDHLDGHMYTEKVEGPLHEVKYEED